MAPPPLPPPPLPPPPLPPPHHPCLGKQDDPGGRSIPPPNDWSIPRYAEGGRRYDLNGKVMLASIISLSVVVALVALLHIYARWLLRRQARRRAALHSLALVARANQSSESPPKTGLDPSVIASLPTFVFRQPDPTAREEKTVIISECTVCLSLLEDEEVVRLLPNCKHTFHAECIDKWLTSHSTCPVCRAEAQPTAPPEPAGQPAAPPPTASPLERSGSMVSLCMEGTSSDGAGVSSPHKRSGSISRLSSFRRMLSGERSSRRIQPEEGTTLDLERQE